MGCSGHIPGKQKYPEAIASLASHLAAALCTDPSAHADQAGRGKSKSVSSPLRKNILVFFSPKSLS
jgi:hypothetical protein